MTMLYKFNFRGLSNGKSWFGFGKISTFSIYWSLRCIAFEFVTGTTSVYEQLLISFLPFKSIFLRTEYSWIFSPIIVVEKLALKSPDIFPL
jgi:hypothetical protein